MIGDQSFRELVKQLLSIRSRLKCEFFELPGFTRFDLESFGAHDYLQRAISQVKLAHESSARGKCQQVIQSFGGR
jgi:hypothetical protein